MIVILLVSFFVSCDKDDESLEEIPAWLQEEIDEVMIGSSVNSCEVYTVTVSKYNGVKYDDLDC